MQIWRWEYIWTSFDIRKRFGVSQNVKTNLTYLGYKVHQISPGYWIISKDGKAIKPPK